MSTGTTTKISKRVEKELHQTKVVIRRLPPDFTKEKFLQTVNPLPANTYFYFAPGDPALGPHGCPRAYIAFEIETEILPFRDQYDGLLLESEKGSKYRMTVEYAPLQSIPKKARKKPDARMGTIEQDPDYKGFLEAYEATEEPSPSLDIAAYLEQLEATKPKEVQPTPLTEYLKDRRGSRSRRGRSAADSKKKHKGDSSRSKGKSSKEELSSSKSSKTSSEGVGQSDGKKKDRGRQDKGSEPPKLLTKDQKDEEKPIQWSVIEPTTSMKEKKDHVKDSKKEYKGRSESGEKYRGEGRTRNRDRPDRAIYTPRSQPREELSRSGERGSGKSKEEGSSYQGRSGRYRGGREDGDYRQRDRDDKYWSKSRDRGRGPRDRQKEKSQGQGTRNDY